MDVSNDRIIPIVVVAGPTATGKSALAIEIAERFSGEVVSADSMQVYRTLDIGTAKIRPFEMRGIRHHMIDIVDPPVRYSLGCYLRDARAAISEIAARGRLPIICGGTGLYVSSLVKGVRLAEQQSDAALRYALSREYDERGGSLLLEEIFRSDPAYAAKLHANDKKRIVRALEQLRGFGIAPSEADERSLESGVDYRPFDIILNYENRETLYSRIDIRVDGMVKAGLLEEARYVFDNKETFHTASQAIGYKELFRYFEGKEELSKSLETLKRASRRYAKRQITWFKQYAPNRFFNRETIDSIAIFCDLKKHLKV